MKRGLLRHQSYRQRRSRESAAHTQKVAVAAALATTTKVAASSSTAVDNTHQSYTPQKRQSTAGRSSHQLQSSQRSSRSSKVRRIGRRLSSKLTNIPACLFVEKLYWISTKNPPNSRCKAFYFCIDNVSGKHISSIYSPPPTDFAALQSLTYEPFFADFGPNNLSCTYKFSVELDH